MSSLSARLLAAVSLLLLLFFGLTIVALETVFRGTAQQAIRDRLDVQLIVLLAAADIDEAGRLTLPETLPEARFMTPGSGLYGALTGSGGELIWRSPSSVGVTLPVEAALTPPEQSFEALTASDDTPVLALSMGVEWELEGGGSRNYVFTAAESLQPYYAEIRRFRGQLLGWFAGLMTLLLAAQAVLLRWVLKPLRRVAREINEVETGRRSELAGGYPTELQGLTRNMNTLINAERARLARYRNTLGNLAHSLKTPLAVIGNAISEVDGDSPQGITIREQVKRMNDIIRYQLQRAAASGRSSLGAGRVQVSATVEKIRAALDKVYWEKAPRCSVEVPEDVHFFGDEGDLTELLGNLLDNAYKYCDRRVELHADHERAARGPHRGLRLSIEDDGPGIDDQDAVRVLTRGVRADERMSGQGIGLAVVQEIVALHDGSIELGRSRLGGARIELHLPPR